MNALITGPTALFETFSHNNKILECTETNAQPSNKTRANWIRAQTKDDIIGKYITFCKVRKPGSRKLNDVDFPEL